MLICQRLLLTTRPKAILCACLICAAWPGYSQAALGSYVASQIRTNAVNNNGERHDVDSTECITAPDNKLFEQASFSTRVVTHKDDDERRCTATFSDYKESAPGILEPRTACLYSFVKSVGGIVSVNKRGHLQCAMDYRTHDDLSAPLPNEGTKGDAKATVVGLPADISLEREKRSLVTISVPLRTLQFSIDKAIREKNGMNIPNFTLTVMSSGFRDYVPDALTLHYSVDLDISGPIGARCTVDARFGIPAATPGSALVQDAGTTVDCKTGSLLGQLADLSQRLSDAIRGAITDNLGKQFMAGNGSFKDWAKDDPELAEIIERAMIQGRYCDWRGEPGLCIAVGWSQPDTIAAWEAKLMGRVPKPEGPIDKAAAIQRLDAFVKVARANHQIEENGIKFPSGKWADGSIEDGDMGIFGGLLCRSGSEDGCQLIQNVATEDGRFWRSPRRIGEAETPEHASFSGDQLKGVLHYLTTTGDKDRLAAFLQYVKSNPTQIPAPSMAIETGYSLCPNFGPNFTCLIGGADWYVLDLLAKKYELTGYLPPDLAAIENRYGFSYDALVWEALMTNSGYRLHLVANNIWILRSLGEKDPRLDKAAAIIASRQPRNPFFLYLFLGADAMVQRLADQKCTDPAARNNYSDWAWQRAESDNAWERSMVWDCVFMYSLLIRDPIPRQ